MPENEEPPAKLVGSFLGLFWWEEVDFAVVPDGGALRKASVREWGERHFLHRASARASRETTAGGVSSFHLFHADRHPKMGACLCD